MWNFAFFARRQITDACLFFFFSQGWSYRLTGPTMSQKGSFYRILKVLVPFLSDQKHWRAPRPPPTLIFPPESPDQNSEIAILFTIVKKPFKYVFGDDLIPQFPWEELQVTNFDLCLHIVMVTGKCTDVFRGIFFGWGGKLRGSYVEGSFHGGTSHGGRDFQWRGGGRIFKHYLRKQWKTK